MLHLTDVHVHYGPVHALRGVSLAVDEGEIVTLIGANGAGKSTLMTSLFGAPRPTSGRIVFAGQDLTRIAPHRVSRLGLALAPEGRRIFARMTVLENLQIGGACVKAHVEAGSYAQDLEQVFDLFPVLKERQTQRAGTLSGGEQQMLAIARALLSRPRLLLLDEPSLGLAPIYIRKIFQIIQRLNHDHGIAVLLVEQNAHHALKIAHRAYVLQHGQIALTGEAKTLADSDEVRRAYLGQG